MSNVVKEMMIEYGITAEAAVERLAEQGDLERKAQRENADTFVARRLGADAIKARRREKELRREYEKAMPVIPSFTVYVDCVGKGPTPGELCEAILDGLEGRFDEIIHVEVLPR